MGGFHVASKNPAIITGSPATDLKRLAEVRSSRGLEDTTGILCTSEQDDRAGIRLLAQALDNIIKHLIVGGAGHLQCGCDANVTLGSLTREHLYSVFSVATLGVHRGDVRPVGALHYVDQCDRLEGVRRYRPREVIEPEDNRMSRTLET